MREKFVTAVLIFGLVFLLFPSVFSQKTPSDSGVQKAQSFPNASFTHLSVTGRNTFQLSDGPERYLPRPFYDIVNQSYGVYATIRKN